MDPGNTSAGRILSLGGARVTCGQGSLLHMVAAQGMPGIGEPVILRLDAAGVLDGRGLDLRPGTLLLDCRRVSGGPGATGSGGSKGGEGSGGGGGGRWRLHLLAVGKPAEIGHHPASRVAWRCDLTDRVLIPALVNAHTHLDLTHIGPRAYRASCEAAGGTGAPGAPRDVGGGGGGGGVGGGGAEAGAFERWLDMIRRERLSEEEGIRKSVWLGVQKSWEGGVVAVGDIAGAVGGRASLAAVHARLESGLAGVSFVEFFAAGAGEGPGVEHLRRVMEEAPYAGVGIQPHAPYSVSVRGFRDCISMAHTGPVRRKVCTHLAESIEERLLIGEAKGPIRGLLERVGVWTPELEREFGKGQSPIEHLGDAILGGLDLAVHVNDCSDADIERLAHASERTRIAGAKRLSVVYCPRASAYFGHQRWFGAHRYRDLLNAGINVAIGTDSIVNLDTPDRISTWDDLCLLKARDGGEDAALLAMATWRGAGALGMNVDAFAFSSPGGAGGARDGSGRPIAGVVALAAGASAAASVWTSSSAPELLCAGTGFDHGS